MAFSVLSLLLFSARMAFSVYAYDWVGLPAVNGGEDQGWQETPALNNADLNNLPIPGTRSVFPVYQSSGLDASQVTRAIIVPGAKARDHWAYWTTMQNIKMDTASTDSTFNPNTTSILTPIFLAEVDIEARGGDTNGQLYWTKTGWFGGTYAKGPNEKDKISSFAVIDALIDHYTNATMYPKMESIILAGHSAAAQFFQRYAALRQPTQNDHRINYIIANTGSYLWLVEDRPVQPPGECEGIDDYKYGLSGGLPGYSTGDFNSNGRSGIVSRYLGRNVHYALGSADDGPGDTSCQAWTQGSTHLERGNNFVAMLQKLPGGMPSTHTLDLIEGVSHQNDQMFNSTQLRQRLFKGVSTDETSDDPTTVSGNADGSNSNNSNNNNNNGNNSSSGNSNNNSASPTALSSGGLLGAATLLAILTIL